MVQVSKPLVIAGVSAVAAAALLAFALVRGNSSSDAKKQAQQEDGVREVPNLHKEQLLSILETICTQMGQVVMQLAKLEAKIRQESSQSGRSLPEDQLASYLMGQFEEAMKAIESQVYAKFQTTEDEVKVATEYFEEDGDKDVANAVAKLQELYRVMTGGGFSDVEVPAELTLTKFIEIMQETMESLNVAMEEVCLEVKELNPDNKEEAINQRYVKRADNLSAEIHAKHGLTREVLQAAMMKYQQEPAFLMAMTELQQQQAERFAAAAAIFNGERITAAAGQEMCSLLPLPSPRPDREAALSSVSRHEPDESVEKMWRSQFRDRQQPCIESGRVDRTKVLHNMKEKRQHGDDEDSPLFLWGLPREHILEFVRQSLLPSSWAIHKFIAELRADPSLWAAFQRDIEQIQHQHRLKIRENKDRARTPRSIEAHELRKKQAAERMERTQRQREQIVQLEDERLAAKREAYLRRVNPTRQLSAAELELTVRYRRRKMWLHVVSFAAISHRWHKQLQHTKHVMLMARIERTAASTIQKIWRRWKWQHASKHTVVIYTWLRKCMWKLLLRVRCRRKTRHATLLRQFMVDHFTESHATRNFNRMMVQWRSKVIRAQKAGMSFIHCNRARMQALSIWWDEVDHERQRMDRQQNSNIDDGRRLTTRQSSGRNLLGPAPGSAGSSRKSFSRAGSIAILGGMDEKLATMQMLLTPIELQRLQQNSVQVVKIPKSIKIRLLTELLTNARKDFRRRQQAYKEMMLCASYAREVKLEEARAIVQSSVKAADSSRSMTRTASVSRNMNPPPCFLLFSDPNGAKTMEALSPHSSPRRPSVSFSGAAVLSGNSAPSASPSVLPSPRYSILKKPTQRNLFAPSVVFPPSVLAVSTDKPSTPPTQATPSSATHR
ncbi:hypothetical protein PHYSODRAFT_313662 [Phytophthora sojae]|uniref:Uncharacterized protein n=1 Tax=Phytophthora sojae (strain P6497) TaxID=1094619 RepID=G4Z3D1_PHYSP|nr:hypothetical protein PHYSODRAFT_313662 [Phytophthora sojae]EGZ21494.1 hypothetical protein PHYSODRAFT_313662 [Phytophthora sojae]|eukprot:XP_009524211.1 hypothetical protein PHYSODRAFT_313662 [Phytophthora sojae]